MLLHPELNPFRSEEVIYTKSEANELARITRANEYIYAFQAK